MPWPVSAAKRGYSASMPWPVFAANRGDSVVDAVARLRVEEVQLARVHRDLHALALARPGACVHARDEGGLAPGGLVLELLEHLRPRVRGELLGVLGHHRRG